MTDIKLLELAARAAGHTLGSEWDCAADGIFIGKGCDGDPLVVWNPLLDDGDVFRLAVTLKMDVAVGQSVKVVCATNEGMVARIVLPLEGGNDFAVVRRAIVRAAAEIGRQQSNG